MNILGVGPLELIFLFVLVLIVLGPNEMVKTGRTLGTFIGNFVRSDFWKAFQTASSEISALPHKLAREANLADLEAEFTNEIAPEGAKPPPPATDDDLNLDGWTTPHTETDPNEKTELE